MNAIKPDFEDETPFNPFNFWGGAPFKLKIRNVEGYINYDKSEFGECCPLFDDDEAMEKVWKMQYPLKDFVAAKQFKTYDELKTKFNLIINSPTTLASPSDGGDDNEPVKHDNETSKQQPAPKSPPPATSTTDDDDDFALFRNMIDD